MKKLAVLAAIATVTSVNAGEVSLKGRFDYSSVEQKTSTGKTTSGQYSIGFLRLGGKAKINESTSGLLSLDLKDSNDATAVNGVSEFVDRAQITKALGMGFSVTLGKQFTLVSGYENGNSSRDLYTVSKFNDSTPNNLVGATVEYEVAGQSFALQHLEGNTSNLVDKKATGIAYYGNFMDGMVKPTASYHKVGTDTSGKYNVFTTLAAQVNWQALTFELDYLMLTQEAATDKELKSIVAHARYTHGMWVPFFKYIKEDGEGSFDMGDGVNARETERTAMELGLEIVPNKDEDFRYHVVYSSAEKKNSTGTANKIEDTKIIAGVAFGMDLLK